MQYSKLKYWHSDNLDLILLKFLNVPQCAVSKGVKCIDDLKY